MIKACACIEHYCSDLPKIASLQNCHFFVSAYQSIFASVGLLLYLKRRVHFNTLLRHGIEFWGLFLLVSGIVFTYIDAYDVNLAVDYLKFS